MTEKAVNGLDIVSVVRSEDGELLLNTTDGFIIEGNIYVAEVDRKGRPTGGLIGNNFPEGFDTSKIRLQAYSKIKLLKALGFTLDELRTICDKEERRRRDVSSQMD